MADRPSAVSRKPARGSATLPSTPATLSYTAYDSHTYTMTVDTWTSNRHDLLLTLDAAGTAKFMIGGTIHIGAWQPRATYSGTFTVAVAYN